MSKWTEAFEEHDLHNGISALDDDLSAAFGLLPSEDTDALENASRVKEAIDILRQRLTLVDPNLVSQGVLNTLNKNIQTITSEVRNFKTNKNQAHLNNAAAQIDSLIANASNILYISSSEEVDTLRESVSSFRRSAGQNLRYFEKESNELKAQMSALKKQLQNVEGEINSQKGRLDSAISDFQKQFSEAEQARRQTSVTAEEKRNTQFEEVLSEKEKSLDGLHDAHKEKLSAFVYEQEKIAEEHEEAAKKASRNLVNKIEEDREQAASLVKIIADTGLVGGYQKIADKERNSTRIWHGLVILAMVGLIGFALYAFYSTLSGSVDWAVFASKIFVSLTFGVLAAYAAKQADKHEQIERRNRKMELELAAVGPYLKDLPEELQQKIKEELAHRLFGQKDSEGRSQEEAVSGTSADLLKVTLDSINSLTKN